MTLHQNRLNQPPSGHIIKRERFELAEWRLHCNGFVIVHNYDGTRNWQVAPVGLCWECSEKAL